MTNLHAGRKAYFCMDVFNHFVQIFQCFSRFFFPLALDLFSALSQIILGLYLR